MVVQEVLNLLSSGTRILLSEKEAKEVNKCDESSPYPVLSLVEKSNSDSGARGSVISDKGGEKSDYLICPLASIITI